MRIDLTEQMQERLLRLVNRLGEANVMDVFLKMLNNQEKLVDIQEDRFNELIAKNPVSKREKLFHISKGRIV
jgi:hypothetical protein